MENILTATALWQDYDPAEEPLDSNILKTSEDGGIVTKTVYYTGRTVSDGKTRVLAKLCYKPTKAPKPSVLIIDNYKRPIDENELKYWANNGFVAMAIDFAGRCTGGLCTLYPSCLDYCNSDVAKGYFDVGENATQSKIYEYALNCMRAVTYLLQEENVKSVSVVTVKKGVSVGVIVLGIDKRVQNGAIVFGNLYREYLDGRAESVEQNVNEMTTAELTDRLAYEEKQQIWTAGIAPQGYALQITVPVYVVCSANSAHVDVINISKMFFRLNKDSRMLLLPTVMDYLPDEYTQCIVRWCKNHVDDVSVSIKPLTDGGNACVQLTTTLPSSKIEVWYCRNAHSRARNWVRAPLKKHEEGYVAELDVYTQNCELAAFALIKGPVATSTAICEMEVIDGKNIKIPVRSVFLGSKKNNILPVGAGESWHGHNNKVSLCPGYLDIVGAKGRGLLTFAINDPCVRRNEMFAISFDVCCDVQQVLSVYATCDFGGENRSYVQTVQLKGDGKWQHVTLEGADFRFVGDSHQMSEDELAQALAFVAQDEFILNNVFLV